jgi:hypothetical protein
MAGKFPSLGDFDIPTEIIDLHEWVADAFIDDEFGHPCTLIYPHQDTECPNCIRDPRTKRSSGIYKTGGPTPFPNHTTCPYCGGEALATEVTEPIRLRVYWQPKDWIDIGIKIDNPDQTAMTIGYMVDLPKVEKAQCILLEKKMATVRKYKCKRKGEAAPWGFHHDRYFIQYMERTGGG